MSRNLKFWTAMAVFQVLFGFVVFAVTRDYYTRQPEPVRSSPVPHPELSPGPTGQFADIDVGLLDSLSSDAQSLNDPAEIARLADQHFANRQYNLAARYYERLLDFDKNNADTLNNLGLTLHYIGRSGEALQRLEEGVAVDPGYQRIWLTLGYVNSQLGNREEARTALEKASAMDAGNSIGQSALRMLDELN